MGASSSPRHVYLCLTALEATIRELGGAVQPGAALAAAQESYASAA
jgi:aspartate aminotransferase-like enzyme